MTCLSSCSARLGLAALFFAGYAALSACSSTTVTQTGGGEDDGGTESGSTSGGDSGSTADAASAATPLEAYCAAKCGTSSSSCTTDPRSKCYAALATSDNVSRLKACVAESKCSPSTCGISSAATTAYVDACKAKAGACGGSMGGISAGDCDDVVPLFRDDVATAMKACFSSACADVSPCLVEKAKSAEPTACSGL